MTNRWEVGVGLRIVRVELSASGQSSVIRLATDPDGHGNDLIHSWDGNGQTTKTNPVMGASASGIGDIVVRSKYRVVDRGAAGASVSVDLRLPTGKSDELLGTGATQAKFMFIGAASIGDRVFPHLNLGYTFSAGDISDLALHLTGRPANNGGNVDSLADISLEGPGRGQLRLRS